MTDLDDEKKQNKKKIPRIISQSDGEGGIAKRGITLAGKRVSAVMEKRERERERERGVQKGKLSTRGG